MGKIPTGTSFSQNFFSAMHPTMAATSNSGQSNALTTMKETSTMKAKLLTTIGCLLLMAGLVHANAVLSFNDNNSGDLGPSAGTYAPGSSFSFDITLSVANSGTDPVANAVNSISYWFETSALNNGYFSITNRNLSGSPFSDPQSSPTYPNAVVAGGNASDLGASTPTSTSVPTDASYFVATLTLQIAPNTPAGTYTIATTTRNSNTDHSKTTAVGDTSFTRHEPVAAVYTITVVPEPATLSLLALSGLGSFGLNVLRRRRG
jgi:hypothetical protein